MSKIAMKGSQTVFNTSKEIEQEKRVKKFRREVSRKASLANKRIARLENNDLKDTPAYQRYMKDGGDKFSVRGKTYREVQSELKRLNRFIDSTTSTVRGAHKVLKDMAKNTNQTYKNLGELKEKASKFFELASKTEQYLRHVHDAGSAIGYQQIWEQINTYVKESNQDLADGTLDVDQMVEAVSNALLQYEDPLVVNETGDEWFLLKD